MEPTNGQLICDFCDENPCTCEPSPAPWHIGEAGVIHWQPDPGDGLCSPVSFRNPANLRLIVNAVNDSYGVAKVEDRVLDSDKRIADLEFRLRIQSEDNTKLLDQTRKLHEEVERWTVRYISMSLDYDKLADHSVLFDLRQKLSEAMITITKLQRELGFREAG